MQVQVQVQAQADTIGEASPTEIVGGRPARRLMRWTVSKQAEQASGTACVPVHSFGVGTSAVIKLTRMAP